MTPNGPSPVDPGGSLGLNQVQKTPSAWPWEERKAPFLWEARWPTPHRSRQPTAPLTHGSCSSSDLGCVPDPPLYTDLVKLPPQKGLLNHFQPLQRTPGCRNITS